jgi:S1-C subfamily serine protease
MTKTANQLLAALAFASLLLASGTAAARHRRASGGKVDAHCIPSFGESRIIGMKCTGIKPSSILHKVGVKDGDIVTSVDGKPTLSPRDMMTAMKDLKDSTQSELKVIREGKERTLSYAQ